MASKQEIATVANTAVSLLSDLDVFAEFAGAGFENVRANDMLVPRLAILQSLSPQLKKSKASYIEGAQVGDIVDTGTGELMPQPTTFLPVYYRKDFIEWKPRNAGGGLVRVHPDDSILSQTRPNEKNKPVLPNGNEIIETAQLFGLNMTAGGRACFIAFSSTQLKKARRLLTLANGERIEVAGRQIQPPLFYRTYLLGTAEEAKQNDTWAGWTIERGPVLTELPNWRDVMKVVTDFRASLQRGEATADTSSLDAAAQEAPL